MINIERTTYLIRDKDQGMFQSWGSGGNKTRSSGEAATRKTKFG